ncbi:MAG: MotA/TolQ/ExbB proton channel family protein [Planctomycetota bacterium]
MLTPTLRSYLLTLCIAAYLACHALAQAPPPQNFGSSLSSEPSARLAANPATTAPGDPVSLGGSATPAETEPESQSIPIGSLIGIFREGGALMIAILLCSVVLVIFTMERWFFLRKGRIMPRLFVRGVFEQLEQGQIDQEQAILLCEENGSPISELFSAALKKWGRPAVEVEQAVMDTGEHVTSQLKRYLRLFSTISNIAPLLGLLGTVLGMIDAFNSIAQADAMGRPEMLASGIGGALLTTAAGLCVAIPAYAAHAYFIGRSDRLILEMDKLSQNVIDLICAENQTTKRRSRKAA